MKKVLHRFLAALLIALLCAGTVLPALAENDAATVVLGTERASAYQALKRGKTVKLWAWGFADQTKLSRWDPMAEESIVKGVKLSKARGEITAEVVSGGSWLTAAVRDNRVIVKVKGTNTKTKNLTGVVKIYDAKGLFGKVKVVRGGMVRFSEIRQHGATVRLTVSRCKGAGIAYVRRVVWNTRGENVSTPQDTQIAEIQPGTGKVVITDTHFGQTGIRPGYTYAYLISYKSPASVKSWRCSAAVIVPRKRYASLEGTVKTVKTTETYYDLDWLYGLAH